MALPLALSAVGGFDFTSLFDAGTFGLPLHTALWLFIPVPLEHP